MECKRSCCDPRSSLRNPWTYMRKSSSSEIWSKIAARPSLVVEVFVADVAKLKKRSSVKRAQFCQVFPLVFTWSSPNLCICSDNTASFSVISSQKLLTCLGRESFSSSSRRCLAEETFAFQSSSAESSLVLVSSNCLADTDALEDLNENVFFLPASWARSNSSVKISNFDFA